MYECCARGLLDALVIVQMPVLDIVTLVTRLIIFYDNSENKKNLH